MINESTLTYCPGSVSGHDGGDRDGLCTWCRRRVNSPVGMPLRLNRGRTELDEAYRRMYDPDWGLSPLDY